MRSRVINMYAGEQGSYFEKIILPVFTFQSVLLKKRNLIVNLNGHSVLSKVIFALNELYESFMKLLLFFAFLIRSFIPTNHSRLNFHEMGFKIPFSTFVWSFIIVFYKWLYLENETINRFLISNIFITRVPPYGWY